jgi:hypothetical protein
MCFLIRAYGRFEMQPHHYYIINLANLLIARPPRATWFQPEPSFSCSVDGSGGTALGAGRRARADYILSAALSLQQPPLLPSAFCNRDNLLCGYLRSCSTYAAALGWPSSRRGGVPACYAPEHSRSCDSRTAELWYRTWLRNIRASRHRHSEVRCQGAVLLGVLIPSPRSKRHDSLHMDVQGLQRLWNLGFGHAFALKFFNNRRPHLSSGSEKVRKFTPSLSSRDRRAPIAARKPSAASGTSIRNLPFIWTTSLLVDFARI